MNNVKVSTERLKEYFYNRFKGNDYQNTLMSLYNVNEREKVINELAENQEEAYYFNNIYEKTLKNISIIFKNNDTYLKSEQKKQNEILQKQIKEQTEQEQKKEKRTQLYKTLVNIFFIFVNPITIIIYLLIWGYFKFAAPIL